MAERKAPPGELEEARREAEHYRRIAEEAGTRRLREAEALSRLLERAQEAERQLQQARDELERRVAERTAELTTANAHLSREVEERQRAEAALRASEEAFRSFMAHFPGLAYVKEADTTVVFASEGFRTYLGIDPAAMRGRTNAEVMPAPFAAQITRDDLRVLASGRAEHIAEEFAGRSWITHKFVIPRADGALRLGGLTLDVTEARRSEEERRRLERQMEQAQRIESLGVLAGGIAHDFNNLLTSILGNVAYLQSGAGELDAECLADVEHAGRAAAGLCQQLLAYAGKAPFSAEPIAPGDLVRDMVQLLRSSVSRKIALDLHLADGLPPLRADPSQLRRVVMNLVINAAEAIGDGDGTITVRAEAVRASRERLGEAVLGQDAPEGAYVVLEVADTGCGMDAATQRRIFEPFYSSKFAGRGLGLPAVLGIVRQLAGAIEVESAPGSGARFRVLLPAAEAAGVASAALPEQDSEPWTGEGLVLVVDDDASVRKVAERSLVRLGFDVLEAEGGAQAVELYRRHRWLVRAVLLDLTMPHLDGVETLRLLREVDPDVFVIVASGHATAEVMARFHAAPPAAHVQKPFGIEQLRRLLRAAPPRRGPGASAG